MKKKLTAIATLAFAAALSLALVGCGGGESTNNESENSSSGVESNSVSMTDSKMIYEDVCDDEVATVTVVKAVQDEEGDSGYVLEVTNNTEKIVYVCATDSYIGGEEIYMDGADILQPGETRDVYLYFYATDLGGGIENLVDVEFLFTVWVDAETPTELLGAYEVAL